MSPSPNWRSNCSILPILRAPICSAAAPSSLRCEASRGGYLYPCMGAHVKMITFDCGDPATLFGMVGRAVNKWYAGTIIHRKFESAEFAGRGPDRGAGV